MFFFFSPKQKRRILKLTSTSLILPHTHALSLVHTLSLLRLLYCDLMQEDFSLEDVNKALIQISPESLLTGFLNSAPCLPDAAACYLVPMLTSLSLLIKEQVQAAEPSLFLEIFTALSHTQSLLLLTDSSSPPVISALH